VLAVEGVARLGCVVEGGLVEGTELGVDAGVLDVARHAVVADVSVDSLAGVDPLRDGLVAGETTPRGDLLAGLVALLAVLETFELGMGRRERAG